MKTLYVCWDVDGYDWRMVIDHTEIIETKLDTLRFQFNNMYSSDLRGIPNINAYVGDHCGALSYIGPNLRSNGIATVEAKWKLRVGSNRYFHKRLQ